MTALLPLPLRHGPTQAYERREMAQVMPVLRLLARECPGFRQFPVVRMLQDVGRLCELGLPEALLLVHLVRATRWATREACVAGFAGRVRDLVCFVHGGREYRELLLYLLLASYSAKEALTRRQPALLLKLAKICPDFQAALHQWSLRHAQTLQELHPRLLNRLYVEVLAEQRRALPDYLATVDRTLDICTPYSEKRVEGNRLRIERLRREAEAELWGPKPQKLRKLEKNFDGELCATFQEVVELCSTDSSSEEPDRHDELGRALGHGRPPAALARAPVAEPIAESEEEYCESLRLGREDSQEHVFFLKHEDYPLPFFCEDSPQHLC